MNSLAPILLNVLIAVGNDLLKREAPLIQALGGASVALGENALGTLGDSSIPFDQKKLLWQQGIDAVKAAAARCEDQIPNLANSLIGDIASIAFESLIGRA